MYNTNQEIKSMVADLLVADLQNQIMHQQSQLKQLADALKLVNNIIYAVGAPLGSDNYFTIREVCCKALKQMEVGDENT